MNGQTETIRDVPYGSTFTLTETPYTGYTVQSVSAKDYKTLLQEYVQHHRCGELEYTVIGINGPDHKRVFTMQVSIGGIVYGFGDGGTKQEAGQNAAKATLELLNLHDIEPAEKK